MPTKAQIKKGRLEVKFIKRSRRGLLEDNFIEPGTIGYVISMVGPNGHYVIYFPHLVLRDSVSVHNPSDYEPTGNRG